MLARTYVIKSFTCNGRSGWTWWLNFKTKKLVLLFWSLHLRFLEGIEIVLGVSSHSHSSSKRALKLLQLLDCYILWPCAYCIFGDYEPIHDKNHYVSLVVNKFYKNGASQRAPLRIAWCFPGLWRMISCLEFTFQTAVEVAQKLFSLLQLAFTANKASFHITEP